MDIREVYQRVRNYLIKTHGSAKVDFDFKSYDDENDIPTITFRGEKRRVCSFEARSDDTIFLVLSPYWHQTALRVEDIDEKELYDLLADVFYETNESWEVGDFEMDLLGLK